MRWTPCAASSRAGSGKARMSKKRAEGTPLARHRGLRRRGLGARAPNTHGRAPQHLPRHARSVRGRARSPALPRGRAPLAQAVARPEEARRPHARRGARIHLRRTPPHARRPEADEDSRPSYASERVGSEWAVKVVTDRLLAVYDEIKDDYLRERSSDIEDVTRRLLVALSGESMHGRRLTEDAVVVAEELMPSTIAELDFTHIKAVATDVGGWTSHTAIIARGLRHPRGRRTPRLLPRGANGRRMHHRRARGRSRASPDAGDGGSRDDYAARRGSCAGGGVGRFARAASDGRRRGDSASRERGATGRVRVGRAATARAA